MFHLKKIKSFLKSNIFIIIINILFIVVVLSWIKIIPFNKAPDEYVHYHYNVEFIIVNHKLPVSGKDDIEAYKNCRDNNFGEIPCIVSYNIYPQFNYLVSAIFAIFFKTFFGLNYYIGARLASLFWGLIFVNSIYLILLRYISKRISAILTFSFAFIPQILFISSYINADIHSLALTSLFVLALINIIKNFNIRNLIFLSLSFGLFLLAKYNYFLLIPFIFVIILFVFYKNLINKKQLIKIAVSLVCGTVLISGFWYLRNIINYHDILGENFMIKNMSLFHKLGIEQPFSLQTVIFLFKDNYFISLFRSFFGEFDYMNVLLPGISYDILEFSIIILFILFSIDLLSLKKNNSLKYFYFSILFLIICYILYVIYNTVKFDYQAQGRYLFPLITPIIIFIGYCIKKEEKFYKYLLFFCALIVYLIIQSYTVLIDNYVKVDIKHNYQSNISRISFKKYG